ncbi:MAG: helix-turn-helix domain-containing protein [Aestuariivirgaceae bacterium]
MTIRDNIAANLRELCSRKGSIAQACREAGINRQQFNRYLTGEAIPNTANLTKICDYFGIRDTELFQDPGQSGFPGDAAGAIGFADEDWQRVLSNMMSKPLATIPDGTYYLYYGMSDEAAKPVIARSVMFVRTEGAFKTFRRVTNISTQERASWHYYRGDHRGIIVERRHWLYFLGTAADGAEEISLITAQWMAVTPALLSGTALVGGISGPLSLPVIMEPLPAGTKIRSALEGCNIYSADSPSIRPMIINSLELQKRKSLAALNVERENVLDQVLT